MKNYTGDRLNFGLAAELARVEGIPVEIVMVADDAAFERTADRIDSRRGIAGTVFVHKVAGRRRGCGPELAGCQSRGGRVPRLVSEPWVWPCRACTVPAVGKPGFELPDGEIEFGLGIHGERGIRRSPMVPADEIAVQ